MKSKAIIIIVTLIVTCVFSASAWAGRAQRHRWEGVAIGVGATLLSGALFAPRWAYAEPAAPVYYPPPQQPAYYTSRTVNHYHYYNRPHHRRHYGSACRHLHREHRRAHRHHAHHNHYWSY